MPAPVVNSVADKVSGLSESEAEDIWEEVKSSLRDEGEIASNDEGMSDQDWGLLTDSFLDTIASRFDVDKDTLTESEKKQMIYKFFDGEITVEELLNIEQSFRRGMKNILIDNATKAFMFADEDTLDFLDIEEVEQKIEEMISDALSDERIQDIILNNISNKSSEEKLLADFGKDLYFEVRGHGVGFWDGDWDGILPQDAIDYLGDWADNYHLF